MPVIVRKNITTFSLVFTANDGSATQPSAVQAVLTYKDLGGASHVDEITLALANGAWVGTWDTSASGEGVVFWMAYGYGTLQAAAQGSFEVVANAANTV